MKITTNRALLLFTILFTPIFAMEESWDSWDNNDIFEKSPFFQELPNILSNVQQACPPTEYASEPHDQIKAESSSYPLATHHHIFYTVMSVLNRPSYDYLTNNNDFQYGLQQFIKETLKGQQLTPREIQLLPLQLIERILPKLRQKAQQILNFDTNMIIENNKLNKINFSTNITEVSKKNLIEKCQRFITFYIDQEGTSQQQFINNLISDIQFTHSFLTQQEEHDIFKSQDERIKENLIPWLNRFSHEPKITYLKPNDPKIHEHFTYLINNLPAQDLIPQEYPEIQYNCASKKKKRKINHSQGFDSEDSYQGDDSDSSYNE